MAGTVVAAIRRAGPVCLRAIAAVALLVFATRGSPAQEVGNNQSAALFAGEVRVHGELKGIEIAADEDRRSPGVLVVGEKRIAVPPMVYIELPGDSLTLQELLARAPARCRALRQSGLLRADTCARPPRVRADGGRVWALEADTTPRTTLDPVPTDDPPPTIATIIAGRGEAGDLVAKRVLLSRDDESVWGAVTFINEPEGSLRVGGAFGADEGGALVRINDPDARQSVQSGTGCGTEGNCSPDARFRANPTYFTVRFEAGPPACIPGLLGDACAASMRPVQTTPDANVMLPIVVGDHVTARGAFVIVDGVRVFWAHTLIVHTSPMSSDPPAPHRQ